MKNTIATLCLVGSTLALSACVSSGNINTAPPYSQDRTATHGSEVTNSVKATPTRVAPATQVFRRAQSK